MSQFTTRAYADLSVTNAKLANTTITNAKIATDAAIALSKLAAGTDGQLIVANGSGVPAYVSTSGDITLSNAGVFAIGSGVIIDADVKSDAAIAYSKLAALTASRALVSDGSGVVSVSSVTSTELGYVSGVTSSIQTQLNALSSGYNRRTAVKDYIVDNTVVPPTEVDGDRYILSADGGAPHANWDGASAGDIVQFVTDTWVATTPSEGWIAYDDDSNYDYLFVNDGTPAWEQRVVLTTSLSDGKIWVGNGSNVAAAVTMSGDVAISNTGVASIASGVIVNADINASAAIALSKLASGTDGYMIVCNGSAVPAYVAMSGDVTISNAGVTAIGSSKVTNDMLNGSIAYSKLASITAAQILVGPSGDGSPVAVSVTGDVTISDLGVTAIGSSKVTNDMLAGSIADTKLSTISTANKVSGSAVQLNAEASISDSTGLKALKPQTDKITVSSGQASAGAVTLSQTPFGTSVQLQVKGLGPMFLDVDFTVSGTTLTFAGDLDAAGAQEIVENDVLNVTYSYL